MAFIYDILLLKTDILQESPKLPGSSSPIDLSIAETSNEMIVYQPRCLHECVDDRRPDETKSSMFQVLADCLGFGRCCGNLRHPLPAVEFGLPCPIDLAFLRNLPGLYRRDLCVTFAAKTNMS